MIQTANPDELKSAEELRDALTRANGQLSALALQAISLAEISLRQTSQLMLICEAHLAGDSAKVTELVHGMAMHYRDQALVAPRNPKGMH